MMAAPSLSTAAPPMAPPSSTQGGAAADFAAFLANIGANAGQTAANGEANGFDQMLADAPPLPNPTAASVIAAATGAGQGETGETAETDDLAPDDAPDASGVEDLLAVLTAAVAGSTATDAKSPAKAMSAEPTPDAPPATPKPSPAPPLAAVLVAEPQPAAKPLDGGAAMTVLFAQPTAEGAAGIAGTAKPAPVQTRTLDLSNDDVWIEQLARDIVAAKSDSGDISFRLMPRHLGRLDVAMRAEDGGVALKLDTQHETTAKIVTAAQVRLVEDLRQQGVRVVGTDVTCTPGDAGRHHGQGQGRALATPDTAHLIETAIEAEPREEDRPADRRGRFA